MRKKLSLFLLALMTGAGTAFASDTQVDGIYYDFNSSTQTASVTYKGSSYNSYSNEYSGSVVIPSSVTYNGKTYTVTRIGGYAFNGCTSLTSIEIPNSVTSIRVFAFYDCSSLTSVTIPNSVTSIEMYAFYGCTGLPVIDNIRYADTYLVEAVDKTLSTYTIKEGTKWIGSSAFSGCSGLTSVTIPNSVTSIENYAFSGCSSLTSIEIPNSVASIEEYAFYNCTGLTSVTIGNSVTSIGNSAFSGCTGLTSIEIPNSVTSIGDHAFRRCSGLTSVTIPNSVTSIGDGAFRDCTGLTSVTIPNSVTSIGDHAFDGCNSLTSIEISNSVASIGEGAFFNCSSLTSIEIPNSVTSIGDEAFYYCYSLTSVTIPNSVTSIGASAFYGCTGLTSIEIPNSVTRIGASAFSSVLNIIYDGTATGSPWGARNINGYVDGLLIYTDESKTTLLACSSSVDGEIEILNSVTSIGDDAFYNCYSLTSVTIPNSVTSIGDGAFSSCSGLTSVTIPNSVTSIGNSVFYDCYSLTSIEIPNSVTSIGDDAFSGCTGLTSIEIPNSVTSIGYNAFWGCNGLTSVQWNAENCTDFSSYRYSPFYYIRSKITSFTFGDEVEHIPAYLCYDMTQLDSVYIPESVTSIGKDAFLMIDNIYYTGSASGAAWGALHMNNEIILFSASQMNSITSLLSSNQTSEEYYQFTGVISSINEVNTSYGNATFYITDGTTTFYCYRIYDYFSTLFTSTDQLSVGDSVVISSKVQNYKGNTPEATFGRLVYHSANPLFTPDSIMYYGKRKDNSSELKLYSAPDTSTLNIPETVTYDGTTYSVTEIAPGAMYKHKNIKCVVLPKTLKLMPKAFELCDSIETLYYNAENLTKPSTIPFADSKQSLRNVYIGEDVETIPDGIFNNLENISTVHWDATNCEDMQYSPFYYSRTKIQEFGIANNIEHIPANMCWGMPNITEVTIPNTTTYIGKDAFHSCTGLATLYLGENISTYGDSAFAGCSNLTSIYNYRERPAKLGKGTFDGVDYFNCTLYVLAGSVNMYKSTGSDWKDFYFVESIGAETVITENVVVTPNNNTANFVWPSSATADSYTLDIVKNGELICTLHFNANGQLTSIAFNAPARNGNSAPQQTNEQVAGFSFTVTGLDAATKYGYTLTAKDNSGNVVETYTGTFATKGYVASQYTITFVNYDGTELQSSEVAEGEMPVYNGATPAKPEDEQYTYTFTGWTPEISAVSEDATYTATFEATSKSEGIEDLYLDDAIAPHKIFRDGQIFILRGERVYTVTGQEVR